MQVQEDVVTLSGRSRSPRRWFLWGLGNVLIVAGLFAVLYVGGLRAYVVGSTVWVSETPPTPQVRRAPALDLTPTPTPLPALPLLNWDQEAIPHPPTPNPLWRSQVTRVVIAAISVDAPVVPVSWHVEQVGGQPATVWDVAKYAVGHHQGSGNPGDTTNIVLAGHSGGYGAVFRRLVELQPGDEVLLYGQDQQYLYVVEEVVLVKEIGVPREERLENARYMAPTEDERITMITCWPVYVYDHRAIVLARPYRALPFARPDLVEN